MSKYSIKRSVLSLSYLMFLVGLLPLVAALSCAGTPPPPAAPLIETQPQNVAVHDGQRAVFTVEASGATSFQWQRNGVDITGATQASYMIDRPLFSDDGSLFSVVVGNASGTTASDEALLTILPNDTRVMTFTSEGAIFAPILVLAPGTTANVVWTFADGTTSNLLHPSMNYGSTSSRANTLSVNPWSAVRRINLGYDRGDGGTYDIEANTDQHVSSVTNMDLVAPYLVEWCSSYNDLTSLDFSNFIRLQTIECFLSSSLTTVNLANTPSLIRACFEDCSLTALDLSQSPALGDLRGAVNNYPDINFGTIGEDVWHICIRENHFLTDAAMFSNMAQFPQIEELFIWNDHQSGTLRIPSTGSTRNVEIQGSDNDYSTLDLSGSLWNNSHLGIVVLQRNDLTSVNIDGCDQITTLNLSYNNLTTAAVDSILEELDALGVSEINAPAGAALLIDLRYGNNQAYSTTGAAHAQSLASKGWEVYTNGHTDIPEPPANTGEIRIDFSTNGDATSMAIEVTGTTDVIWHWSDGTTSTGTAVSKLGLGTGYHDQYVTVSNGSAVTRFGAAAGGGNGHLVTISGLQNCPYLTVLYAYNENYLTTVGRTNTTRIREYHLMSTALSTAAMDTLFSDALATTVTNGIFYCPNSGTGASAADRAALAARGWTLIY